MILNSTFSGNSAAAEGGGIFYSKTYYFSTLTLDQHRHCQFASRRRLLHYRRRH